MKRYILIILVLTACTVYAQDDLNAVLQSIEANNTTLKAFGREADARKMSNRTGLAPGDPQVMVSHMWGNSAQRYTRLDYSLLQTIDFPTAYRYRSTIADGHDRQTDLEYRRVRSALFREVSRVYTDLVYRDLLRKELEKRISNAESIANAYQLALEKGAVNVLERNKARVNLLNLNKAYEMNEVERQALWDELTRYNGGIPLSSVHLNYASKPLPVDFEAWHEETKIQNLNLSVIENSIAVSKTQEKLSRAVSLPQITAGFVSEQEMEMRFSGVSVGLSIPLWQYKNTVKQTKLQTTALQHVAHDAALQYYNEQKKLHNKAVKLEGIVRELREILSRSNDMALLRKALDQGELPLITYLTELNLYYDTIDQMLEAEHDYHLTLAELWQWAITP